MEILRINGNWEDLRRKLKHNFKHLTDNDLSYVEGREEKLIKNLQKKLGTKKEEVIDILNRISAT